MAGYRPGRPNREVRQSPVESLWDHLARKTWRTEKHRGTVRRILR